ncbi:MAG: ATP-grasp domain-containing protein [Myxococcales bacterium]|nr:ATP-grasp domain-containing protein [Myxococcales bacterium]
MRTIRRLLIANRGEIACRIARTARAHGIVAIAVHTDVDAGALHVTACDEAIAIGSEGSGRSPYLDSAALIDAAGRMRADAIHPGYGFLSERAEFATAVLEAGLLWVGPPPEVMSALGRKDGAKALAREAGVPTVPGFEVTGRQTVHSSGPLDPGGVGEGQVQDVAALAARVGYPVLVKAVAGGGGRGMRVVERADDLSAALQLASQEALAAFGDGALLVEKYVERGRHVEVQILADSHGHVVHLGERECSLQRRHQKVLEETPCPVLDAEMREAITAAALRLARAVGYVSAGTVEFLYDAATRNFWFLEVNTRIQVEHPVTECVTGLDLVAWQVAIAQGLPLTLRQADIPFRGHAVEVRLCAEDPRDRYAPQAGPVHFWRAPAGEGIRVDHGLHPRDVVPLHYDSLLAKVVAWAPTRAMALHRLQRALRHTRLAGVRSNRAFLLDLLHHRDVFHADLTTRWLDQHPPAADDPAVPDAALLAAALWRHGSALQRRFRSNPHRPDVTVLLPGPGHRGPAWTAHVALFARGHGRFGWGVARAPDPLLTLAPALTGEATLQAVTADHVALVVDGRRLHFDITVHGDVLWLQDDDGADWCVGEGTLLPQPRKAAVAEGSILAPGESVVTAVHVAAGARVSEGDPLVALEAMKMLTVLRAPFDGVVRAVLAARGDHVRAGAALVDLDRASAALVDLDRTAPAAAEELPP